MGIFAINIDPSVLYAHSYLPRREYIKVDGARKNIYKKMEFKKCPVTPFSNQLFTFYS